MWPEHAWRKSGLRIDTPGEATNLIRGWRVAPVYLQQAANRQVGIEVVDRVGGTVEQRCDAAGGDDRHCFVPLGLDARDHALDERNVTPENTGLHGADRVVADHPSRFLQRNPGKLRGGGMQGLHREMDARRDHASLEAAITPDYVQCDRGPAVDNDQWSGIELERPERIDQTVRPDFRRLAGPHLDAQLDILTDNQRLDVQIATRQVSQVEDRLRHHTRYHTGIQKAELKFVHRHQLRQPHR